MFGCRDRMRCNRSSFHFSSDISLAHVGVNSVGIDICDIADNICAVRVESNSMFDVSGLGAFQTLSSSSVNRLAMSGSVRSGCMTCGY